MGSYYGIMWDYVMDFDCGMILQDHITGLYEGIKIWNHLTGLYTLRDYIMELYNGTIL